MVDFSLICLMTGGYPFIHLPKGHHAYFHDPVEPSGQPARSAICCHAFREGCRVLVLEHVEVPSAARSAFISHSYESLGLSSVEHHSLNMWGSLSSFPFISCFMVNIEDGRLDQTLKGLPKHHIKTSKLT